MGSLSKIKDLFFSRRYDVEVTGDFPRKSEHCVYLGKVAEEMQDVYLDLDQLTKHTIIAGITGGGKTLAGNVIVEDVLASGASVLILDPTAQWTGIIKPNADISLRRLYDKFHIRNDETRGLATRIILPRGDFSEALNLERIMTPGVATVVCIEHLSPPEVDAYVVELMRRVSAARLPPSKRLRLLLVFDEIHIILPKFGGTGDGFVAIERATREFREFGVGLLLLSQVLEDFLGAIRGNINTEMQMRTTFDEDLEKARLKYGDAASKSIGAAQTGTGLFHNADFNLGKPFFLTIRPPRHNTSRLLEDDLQEHVRLLSSIRSLEKHIASDKMDLLRAAELALMHNDPKRARQYIELLRE